MAGSEQLTLPFQLPRPPRRGRVGHARKARGAHPWLVGLRLLVSLVVALGVAAIAISLLPYRSSIAGVDIVVTASATPSHRGLTVDSSLGSLQFRDVTGLPLGLHVSPVIDLGAVRAATGPSATGTDFAGRARADLEARVPAMAAHFGVAAVLGLFLGALAGGMLFDGALQLVGPSAARVPIPRRRHLRRTAIRVGAVTVAVTVATASWGVGSYRSDWSAQYTVTGLLADVAATPDRLAALDARDSGAADKIRAVLRLQDALTDPVRAEAAPDTAYTILFISDVHRRNIYPYLQQYIAANQVALIVDTGDETLVGNPAELTPDYLGAVAAVTATTPMVWIKGNHDSAGVAARMDAVPGVTVLDSQVLPVFGLQVYGTADPRTYGASGDLGADDPKTVTRVETAAAAQARQGIGRDTYLDLLLAHEPVEADALAASLGPTVRAQASGHVHRQNAESDLQNGDLIRLVEGTTGLGGLLADAGDPMSFSIMAVSRQCQFTRIVRYQLADPALPVESQSTSFGQNSSFVVHYFERQRVATDRVCSTASGVGQPVAADSPGVRTVAEWGAGGPPRPTGTTVSAPAPASSADETGDAAVATGTALASPPP